MLLALQFSPVYVLSTNANDYLIRRTNKNARISIITGLAFVAFASHILTEMFDEYVSYALSG